MNGRGRWMCSVCENNIVPISDMYNRKRVSHIGYGVMTVMSIIIKAGDQKSVVVGKILQQMNDLSTEDPFILVKIIIIKF